MKKGYSYTTKGIMINPKTPKYMNNLDIEERTKSHIDKWWNLPYINTETYSHEKYKKHYKRLKEYESYPNEEIRDIENYEKEKYEDHIAWFKYWKKGIRYDVRCLNGGAWDRTLSLASFDNIEDAIEFCKNYIKENND